MPRLTVTRVHTDDERAAAVEVWAAARSALTRDPTPERRARVAAKVAAGPVTLLATYGERPAGMAVAEPYADAGSVDPSCGHVAMLFVDPARWGNGIGSALVRALQAPPDGTHWSSLSVWTREDNTRGRRLYLARGFVDSGERAALHEGERIVRLRWSR